AHRARHPFPTRRSSDLGADDGDWRCAATIGLRECAASQHWDAERGEIVVRRRRVPYVGKSSARDRTAFYLEPGTGGLSAQWHVRSEEHTSELQSPDHLV